MNYSNWPLRDGRLPHTMKSPSIVEKRELRDESRIIERGTEAAGKAGGRVTLLNQGTLNHLAK